MLETQLIPATVRFGVFELDRRSGELRKQGLKIKLQEQPLRVLQVLLEHPGEVVTREELQRRVWPSDTFVDFDHGLSTAIKKLRFALGDSVASPRFIETLAKRGYRFIAPVESTPVASYAQPTPVYPKAQQGSKKVLWAVAITAAALIAAIGISVGVSGLRSRDRSGAQIRSLAVLPLANLSGDPLQEYFSDGMTDALITDLARISSVRVISRTSVMHYKKTDKTLPEIARELNVDGIIEGTVQHSGERIRVTVQFVQAAADKHLWAESYERDERDIFALERDLAQEIVDRVQAKLAVSNTQPQRFAGPANYKALDAYLRGKYALTRGERGANDGEKRTAAQYFQQSIDADPDFAPAYEGLADAHQNLLRASSEDAATSKRAAQKALKLDANSSEAWRILAGLKWYDFDWSGAEQDYRRAIAANPSNAAAHGDLGALLGAMGHLDQALIEGGIAQGLDPNENQLSPILEMRGEHDRAIELLHRLADMHPDDGVNHYDLYRNYAELGRHKEAVQELETTCTLIGLPEVASSLRRAFASSGYRGAMREWANAMEQLQASNEAFVPENLAYAYLASGDKDRAFYWLSQAYIHREDVSHDFGLAILKEDRLLDPLRSDLRFAELLRRIGLSQ